MADVAENGIEENGDVDVPEIELIIRVSVENFGNKWVCLWFLLVI